MAFFFGQSSEQEYRLRARLSGTDGPINVLAFTDDGKLLASGADDEKLHVWDVVGNKLYQAIDDDLGRWGQITCIKWLAGVSANSDVLSFGTGRGLVLIYIRSKDEERFKELSSTAVFPFNEPVESMDFNPSRSRLALTSHTGRIRVFYVEKDGTLASLWSRNWQETRDMKGVTPRNVRFMNKGEDITIFGLESGAMVSNVAATGGEISSRILKSSIGNVAFSGDKKWMLVDNLSKGFDLYRYPHTSPADSFDIPREKAYIQQGVFLEESTSIACGSDHGKVFVFSLGTSKCLQQLKHGSKRTMIQTVDACSTLNEHLIASGSSDKKSDIFIWEKRLKQADGHTRSSMPNSFVVLILMNVALILLLSLVSVNATSGQNWLKGFYDPAQPNAEQHRVNNAQRVLEKSETILQRNGIDWRGPNWRSKVIGKTEQMSCTSQTRNPTLLCNAPGTSLH